MNRSILVTAAVLTMAGPLGAVAAADQSPGPQQTQESRGTVMGYRVFSITPYWVQDTNGKRARHLTGAEIRIEAQPGMTAEYLRVELEHHLSSAGPAKAALEPVFGVDGSTVEVRSIGDGFVFRITAPDTERGAEIVRRARLLG
jgi:hypothetical protein